MREIKPLIDNPEWIREMTDTEVLTVLINMGESFEPWILVNKYKLSIDWVGNECVCYPFQNIHADKLGEDAALLSVRGVDPVKTIQKAVIWQYAALKEKPQ